MSEAWGLVILYHKYSELRFWPPPKDGFSEVLVARENVGPGSPAMGNRGGPGSISLPSSSRKTCSIATSVKTKIKWHITVTKSLLATALWDISLEVATSLESDSKAENQLFTLAVTAVHWIILWFRRVWLYQKNTPKYFETCNTGQPFHPHKIPTAYYKVPENLDRYRSVPILCTWLNTTLKYLAYDFKWIFCKNWIKESSLCF